MEHTHKEYWDAWRFADRCHTNFWKAKSAKDRAPWREQLELLFKGENPKFPGIRIHTSEFNITGIPTCDAAFVRSPTHDVRPDNIRLQPRECMEGSDRAARNTLSIEGMSSLLPTSNTK